MDLADPDLTRLLDGEELSGLVGEPLFGKIANPRITVLCLRFVNELLTKIEMRFLGAKFCIKSRDRRLRQTRIANVSTESLLPRSCCWSFQCE